MSSQLRLSGGRKLQSPAGQGTRPTTSRVREAVMNVLAPRLHDCHWLDLFSGSGVMGCEALQSGARRVVAVERNAKTAKVCQANLIATASGLSQQSNIEVIRHDVLSWLKRGCHAAKFNQPWAGENPGFNLVYLDPPYSSKLYSEVFKALLSGHWLQRDALVICEHATNYSLETPMQWIEQDRRIYGSSALLFTNPPEQYRDDTDSKHPQTIQAK